MNSPKAKKAGVCRMFANTGACAYTNCKFSHDLAAGPSTSSTTATSTVSPKSVCNFFQRHGTCKFGTECRFSHDLSLPVPVEDPNSVISLYRGWSQLLGNPRRGSHDLTADQMEKFLEDAIRILEIGSIETVQQLIRDLGSDRGLQRIQQVVQAEFVSGYSISNLSFKRHCIPFFRILGHEEMRASLVLEREVGTIFNFIYGPGGRRGITFFTRVAQNLTVAYDSGERDLVESTLYIASLALFNTLNLNQGAVVQEEFRPILVQLDSLLTRYSSVTNASTFAFRSAQHEIGRIKVLLQIADALPNVAVRKPEQIISARVDRLQVDLPGELSREGPRHDNDYAEISKIKVLPTSQEINSHRNEFLPQRSLEYPHHLQGISRVLDFQFRLLREDTSGQIREAVRTVINNWDHLIGENDSGKDGKKVKYRTPGVRTIIYKNAKIENVKCSSRDGIILIASFDQPLKVQALKATARREWWERSKYLALGSLLCLVDSQKRATFLVVCERKVIATEYKRAEKSASAASNEDLASNQERAWITLRFAEAITESDVESVFQLYAAGTQVLVEFPGLLFASFDPILRSLQQISKDGNLPFPNWLAPSPTLDYLPDPNSNQYVDVPPPLYMMKPGMRLDLQSITNGTNLVYSVGSHLKTAILQQATTLDHGQCEALLASLSRELALIQGPPGTGKSYLGVQIVKVLLANRDATGIGPIICVCYTNHALDQFLEHLLDDGIKSIVRIGSRSKSPRVAELSLHLVAQQAQRTPLERYQFAKARDELLEIEKNIEAACKHLLKPSSPTTLKSFLESAYPLAFKDIFGEGEDEEGFIVIKNKTRNARRDAQQMVDNWVEAQFGGTRDKRYAYSNRPIDQLRNTSVLTMSRIERQKLLEYWYEEMKEKASGNLLQAVNDHTKERQSISRQQQEQERRCLQDSHVIGLTTTGFAAHADLIRSINAKVLICEEAAEVLEAHILTALLPTMEHAILIGDHLQLRPQIMNHDFSVENPRGGQAYGLNTSLFERAVEVERYGGKRFPVAKLDTQRRMYPSIANLVRNTLYPELIDYPSTANHTDVTGMAKRLFWMDHRNPEAGDDGLELIQTSHANEFEADIVVGLVRHLSRQGVYKSGEIAVLSPYLRQLFILRRKLASMFEVVVGDRDQEQLDEAIEAGQFEIDPNETSTRVIKKGALLNEVRVATVDNFQGEEAKVIIISLVRSNKKNACGFLKTSNRINVLLSRARDGMYIIGNAETCGQVEMWSKVISMLERDNSIDKHLPLRCARHPETPIFITQAEEFQILSPEGGCNERCQWRLDCGHPCLKKCHSELLHQNTVCFEPCNRSFKHCNHACPKPCGEACGSCDVRVPGVALPCGHVLKSVLCHQLQDLSQVKCNKLIERKLEPCGHEVVMPCHQNPTTYKCKQTCGGLLPCGHRCSSLCSSCRAIPTAGTPEERPASTVHGPCRVTCGRNYTTCPHSCKNSCHGTEKCPPCNQPCAIRCDHSVCGKKCSEPCAPCAEQCNWGCKHRQRCDMPCAVPCSINPCSKRCDKQLDCGHQCPSVCGESCPSIDFCQICAREEVAARGVDLITFESYADIDLDTDPIIVPTCGHFYTMSTYDGIMRMQIAYLIGGEGQILEPRELDSSEAREGDEGVEKLVVKNCPDCRAPLRNIHRYNRIVKVAYLDESKRRFCTTAQANYLKMYKEVSDAQNLLQANRSEFLVRLRQRTTKRLLLDGRLPFPLEDRIVKMNKLLHKVRDFINTVAEEEQPYAKVRDMVLSQQRRRNVSGNFSIANSAVQMGFRLKSFNLLIEFRWESLWDLHTIAENDSVDGVTQAKLRRHILKEIPQIYNACSVIIEECTTANLSKHEVEARVGRAQLFALHQMETRALSRLLVDNGGQQATPSRYGETELNEQRKSLDRCDMLCQALPGTVGPLKAKVDGARKLLRGETFYEPVSPKEKEEVYLAMAAEFSTTGRWYTCANGHPFTIGDCGQPNQVSRCPECGAGIGGNYGRGLVSGVRGATDFAELDERLGRMRLR